MKNIVNKEIAPLYEKIQGEWKDDPIADELLYGTEAEVLEEKGEWVRVRSFYRYEGWMRRKFLIPKKKEMEKKRLVMVQKISADVLAAPDVKAKVLKAVPKGGILLSLGDAGVDGWCLIQLWDGRTGFIKESAVFPWKLRPQNCVEKIEDEEECHLRHSLVETARTYQGVSYRWGGKTPLGIDCSGLCFMVYLFHGIMIYRDAAMPQEFAVREIALEQVKPGDLLYYPGHMAMYLGNSYYIHATAHIGSDGVVVNSLEPTDCSYRADLARPRVGSIFRQF